jgi:hypothetical protein
MSAHGPSLQLVRRSDMSGVEVKVDSKSMTSFGTTPRAGLAVLSAPAVTKC